MLLQLLCSLLNLDGILIGRAAFQAVQQGLLLFAND